MKRNFKIIVFIALIAGFGLFLTSFNLAQENKEQISQQDKTQESGGWLTNKGSYKLRTYCMLNPDGTPDWNFIAPTIILNNISESQEL